MPKIIIFFLIVNLKQAFLNCFPPSLPFTPSFQLSQQCSDCTKPNRQHILNIIHKICFTLQSTLYISHTQLFLQKMLMNETELKSLHQHFSQLCKIFFTKVPEFVEMQGDICHNLTFVLHNNSNTSICGNVVNMWVKEKVFINRKRFLEALLQEEAEVNLIFHSKYYKH